MKPPKKILVVDIGGSKFKLLATGHSESRRALSGRDLTPARMVREARKLAGDWEYEAVSIGVPGLVGDHGPKSEPGNLGLGWVGFDFAAAFDRPVKVINDAAMQALGCYEGGRMLFLGLGTGLGSALIAERVIVPLELGRFLLRRNVSLADVLGRRGLDELGKRTWRKLVRRAAANLKHVFEADSVVLGGGNSKQLRRLPPGVRLGHNNAAFRGGFRLWGVEDVPVLTAGGQSSATVPQTEWRLI